MSEKHYCSTCRWSTDEPQQFPPRWRCLLWDKVIMADEDAEKCKDYIKLSVLHE